jgi:DNA-binding transcriptional regulator YhcF (GntR family)
MSRQNGTPMLVGGLRGVVATRDLQALHGDLLGGGAGEPAAPGGRRYMTSMADLFSSRELQSLQGEAPTPLYFQLFTLLKNRILNGSIPHGEQMPTEEELAKGFGVSRITAKRALDDLAAAELVERRRGKGTFVTYTATFETVHAPLMGELEMLSNMAKHTHIKVLDVGEQLPPGDVAAEMGLDRGELAWRATRIRCTEDGRHQARLHQARPGKARAPRHPQGQRHQDRQDRTDHQCRAGA